MGSNEWFEYDLAEDSGHAGTTDPLPVSGVQTIMGLQNSGAKVVHRSVFPLSFKKKIFFCSNCGACLW